MLSIHNLSAGAQNITGAYIIIMLVYRRLPNNYACLQVLVNNALTWQSSCVIANNARKTAKNICPSIILKVHDVIKYTCENIVPLQLIISHASQFFV